MKRQTSARSLSTSRFSRRAKTFAAEGEEELVIAVRTMQAGEAGVEIATIEELLDGGGSVRLKGWLFSGPDLPGPTPALSLRP